MILTRNTADGEPRCSAHFHSQVSLIETIYKFHSSVATDQRIKRQRRRFKSSIDWAMDANVKRLVTWDERYLIAWGYLFICLFYYSMLMLLLLLLTAAEAIDWCQSVDCCTFKWRLKLHSLNRAISPCGWLSAPSPYLHSLATVATMEAMQITGACGLKIVEARNCCRSGVACRVMDQQTLTCSGHDGYWLSHTPSALVVVATLIPQSLFTCSRWWWWCCCCCHRFCCYYWRCCNCCSRNCNLCWLRSIAAVLWHSFVILQIYISISQSVCRRREWTDTRPYAEAAHRSVVCFPTASWAAAQ